MVEWPPATRSARVRFPVDAFFFEYHLYLAHLDYSVSYSYFAAIMQPITEQPGYIVDETFAGGISPSAVAAAAPNIPESAIADPQVIFGR